MPVHPVWYREAQLIHVTFRSSVHAADNLRSISRESSGVVLARIRNCHQRRWCCQRRVRCNIISATFIGHEQQVEKVQGARAMSLSKFVQRLSGSFYQPWWQSPCIFAGVASRPRCAPACTCKRYNSDLASFALRAICL